jgi:hypothetical protein
MAAGVGDKPIQHSEGSGKNQWRAQRLQADNKDNAAGLAKCTKMTSK